MRRKGDGMSAWDVRYARQFAEQLAELPDVTYDRAEGSVDILASNPGLARRYDPQYEVARARKSSARSA